MTRYDSSILNKFITSLRTAVENGKDSLEKDVTSFDAFRLSLLFWH